MSDSITSAFSEATEQTTSIFGNTHKMVFIGLIILGGYLLVLLF
jgi:hypothetical protein